ncbi:MAG: protein translocase subunit SecF [Oceanidesulfovibrio sp.]
MGLNILKNVPNVNFIGARKVAFIISAALILLGVGSLMLKGGPSYGIDFAGGINVQLKFQEEIDLSKLRDALGTIGQEGMTVQRFGMQGDNEYLMRLVRSDIETDELRQAIDAALQEAMAEAGHEIQRVEMVGPKVGADLRQKALEAMFYAVLLIAIYISGRFEQRWWAAGIMAASLAGAMYLLGLIGVETGYLTLVALAVTMGLCWYLKLNYALGAVVALLHDVLITVGVFSLLDKEFDLTIVAALLTIIGYSLNDTIIVFDRIRENLRNRISKDFGETINISINQTLSRTILTSGTTLMVIVALYILGGGVIHDFALALLIGIGVGTYSSIFVASPVLLVFQPREEDPNAPAPANA